MSLHIDWHPVTQELRAWKGLLGREVHDSDLIAPVIADVLRTIRIHIEDSARVIDNDLLG